MPKNVNAQQRLMKDGLNEDAITRIAMSLDKCTSDFDVQGFSHDAIKAIDGLELKQRVQAIMQTLHHYLPREFSEAAEILLQLKPHWDWGDPEDSMRGFAAWPVIDYASVYGLEYPELSLSILKELTALFSAEFAIRPFFIQHYDVTYRTVQGWLNDEDYHVRRLASEGARPRLPWGLRLQNYMRDPEPLRPILEALKDDDQDYVYRSVANSLNDISKDHPQWVVDICMQWHKQGASDACQWVIKHATRGLVKAGYPEVFALLGYTENPQLEVSDLCLDSENLTLGDSLDFSFQIKSVSAEKQRCVLDYVIYYQKANGSLSPKVYKLKNIDLQAGESMDVSKSQAFKPISTRQFYAGEHRLAILVNGKEKISRTFQLRLD